MPDSESLGAVLRADPSLRREGARSGALSLEQETNNSAHLVTCVINDAVLLDS